MTESLQKLSVGIVEVKLGGSIIADTKITKLFANTKWFGVLVRTVVGTTWTVTEALRLRGLIAGRVWTGMIDFQAFISAKDR